MQTVNGDLSTELHNLHDKEIIEIIINRFDKTVKLIIVDAETLQKSSLMLSDVSELHISGINMQNVILDVMIFEGKSSSEYFFRCCNLLKISPNVVPEFSLIYIEPSWGCELAASFCNLQYSYL